jgi:Endomembrane protein 70
MQSICSRVAFAVVYGYNHNWILDDLSSAVIVRHDHKATIARYGGDFRMGFLNQADQIPYTYNLVHIGLDCLRGSIAGYRVVRFAVEPFLFQHEHSDYKTIKTCLGNRTHMSRGAIQSSQRVAVEEICYLPHNVIRKESDVEWSSHLSEDQVQVHWYSSPIPL